MRLVDEFQHTPMEIMLPKIDVIPGHHHKPFEDFGPIDMHVNLY
jgi:hypothetical protein